MEAAKGSDQQLTIFFSGSVNVFSHVPPHKAQAIMLLLSDDYDASNSIVPGGGAESLMQTHQPQLSVKSGVVENGKPSYPPPFFPLQGTPIRPFTPTTSDGAQMTPFMKKQAPAISKRSSQAELPFARKASLARFLEKRKDRILETVKRNEGAKVGDDYDDAQLLGIPSKKLKL